MSMEATKKCKWNDTDFLAKPPKPWFDRVSPQHPMSSKSDHATGKMGDSVSTIDGDGEKQRGITVMRIINRLSQHRSSSISMRMICRKFAKRVQLWNNYGAPVRTLWYGGSVCQNWEHRQTNSSFIEDRPELSLKWNQNFSTTGILCCGCGSVIFVVVQ